MTFVEVFHAAPFLISAALLVFVFPPILVWVLGIAGMLFKRMNLRSIFHGNATYKEVLIIMVLSFVPLAGFVLAGHFVWAQVQNKLAMTKAEEALGKLSDKLNQKAGLF